MSPDNAMYMLSLSLVPAFAFAVWIQSAIIEIKRINAELLHMHKNPDNTGFGTAKTNELIVAQTIATKDLTAVMKALGDYFKGRDAGIAARKPIDHGI